MARRRPLTPAAQTLRRLSSKLAPTRRVAPATKHRPALAVLDRATLRRHLTAIVQAYRDEIRLGFNTGPLPALPTDLTRDTLYDWWDALGPRQDQYELAQLFPALLSLDWIRTRLDALDAKPYVGTREEQMLAHTLLALSPVVPHPFQASAIATRQAYRAKGRKPTPQTLALRAWAEREHGREPLTATTLRGRASELAARLTAGVTPWPTDPALANLSTRPALADVIRDALRFAQTPRKTS